MTPMEAGLRWVETLVRLVISARFLRVVVVGAEEHLFVGEGGAPAEALLDAGGVEDEAFGDHLVVVGAEGGDAEFVGEHHGGDGRGSWVGSGLW